MKRGADGQTRSKTAEFKNVRSMQYLKLYMGKYNLQQNESQIHPYHRIYSFKMTQSSEHWVTPLAFKKCYVQQATVAIFNHDVQCAMKTEGVVFIKTW